MGIFRASARKSTGLAHIFGSGKRKVERSLRKKEMIKENFSIVFFLKPLSFAPSAFPKNGYFSGFGSQVHRTCSYFWLWKKKSEANTFGKRKVKQAPPAKEKLSKKLRKKKSEANTSGKRKVERNPLAKKNTL